MTGRPSKTQKYPNIIPFFFELSTHHRTEYSKITPQGYPSVWLPGITGQQITVILGKWAGGALTPHHGVFTCIVGGLGKISSVGKEHAGKDITIIYEIKEY